MKKNSKIKKIFLKTDFISLKYKGLLDTILNREIKVIELLCLNLEIKMIEMVCEF